MFSFSSNLQYFAKYCLAPGAGALLVVGCTSVSQHDAFQPVQSNVAALTGQRVVWNTGSAADQQVDGDLHCLLARPLTANDAAQVALLDNPDLQATFEEIGISQADLVQAGLLKNPTFALSLRFPDGPPGATDAEYSLAQDVLSDIILPLKIKVAQANLEAAQNRVTHEVVDLIEQVKEQFYTYQAQLQLGQRLKLILDADQAGVDVAAEQHKAGNLNDSGYVNQQTQVAGAREALASAQREMVATREKLNRLMGLDGADIAWTAHTSLPPLPSNDPPLAHLEKIAAIQRRDLVAAQIETNAIGKALALKTGTRFFPAGIDLGVDTEKTPDSQRVTGPTLSLDLPLFDQGQGEIAKLRAQQRQAQARLRAMTLRIHSEIREARAALEIDRSQVDYLKKVAVPLNIRAVNDSLLQFNAMEMNTYELFMAKQRELDTERQYIEAWRDYWISRAQLEEAVGGNLQGTPIPSQKL